MKNLVTPKGLLPCLLVFALFFISSKSSAQTGRIAEKVNSFKQNGSFIKESTVFTMATNVSTKLIDDVSASLKQFTLLDIAASSDVLQTKPAFLNFAIPINNGSSSIRVLLYKESISPNGFTLQTSDGKKNSTDDIVHYKGSIDADEASVVAFSFSKNEVMGFISNDHGNYVIGKLNNNSGKHIIYNSRDLTAPQASFDCNTNTDIPLDAGNYYRGNESTSALTTKCVNWYWETDYDLFLAKQSNAATVNTYMQAVFNQVQTLYANDGISITLKTLYIWTTVDPYTGTSTSNYLNQFGVNRTSFDGDLATLIGTQGSGGIAWINGLCNSQNKYKMAYCGISTSYSAVPNYSWTVECITHEQGHLLGSRHTHDCVWNGNNTKIDGCGDNAGYTSGTCANPGNPTGGGTIMSYCHLLQGVGINFNLGFGPQPKALIINNVNNASCLVNCSTGCTTPGQPAAISGTSAVCTATSQTYSVTTVAGATGYIWTLPSGWSGTSSSNSITVTVGTASGNISVTATNTCGSGTARTLAVTAVSVPSQPGAISGNTAVCAGTSQAYSVAIVAAATSYTWTLPSGWSGTSTSNSINTTAGASGGNISVKANNVCGSGVAKTLALAITASTPAQPGAITGATTVCPGSTQTYSVSAVSGASGYTWTLPSGWSGTSTSNSIIVTAGTVAGNISVSASNGCGTSVIQTIAVSIGGSVPAAPGTIAVSGGTANVCTGDNRTYSVPLVQGFTYNWLAPAGTTINSGQNTNSVTIGFTAAFISGSALSVTASNSCGSSPATSITISKTTIARPGTITIGGGSPKVCPGDSRTYSISPVAGITNYNWSVPTGASITSGQGTATISVTYTPNFITNGTLSVTANNNCGTSLPKNLTIARNNPGSSAAITGPATICAGTVGTYTATAVASATGYLWTIPAGGIAQGATNGNVINILWGTTGGTLAVKATNACGVSGSRSLKIIISCAPRLAQLSTVDENPVAVIYPNPTSDIARVRFSSKENSLCTFTITDVAGRKLLTDKQQATAGMNVHQFNLSKFTRGTYLLLIETKDGKQVLKINVL
ncbi:MAG: M12 family metallo-peptidase [Ferruginibacter sp.]